MIRAVSSVGRALHLQCRGQRFESATVHQIDLVLTWLDENAAVATATRRGRLTHQQMRTGDRIRYGTPSKNRSVSKRGKVLLRICSVGNCRSDFEHKLNKVL